MSKLYLGLKSNQTNATLQVPIASKSGVRRGNLRQMIDSQLKHNPIDYYFLLISSAITLRSTKKLGFRNLRTKGSSTPWTELPGSHNLRPTLAKPVHTTTVA